MIWVVKHQEVMVDLGQLGFNCGILKGQKTEKQTNKIYMTNCIYFMLYTLYLCFTIIKNSNTFYPKVFSFEYLKYKNPSESLYL